MKKDTDELLKMLESSSDVKKFLNENQNEFIQTSLAEILRNKLAERKLSKSEAIRRADLDRVYGYQIFSGQRSPSRDKLIQICLGMQLTLPETQQILKAVGMSSLYPRNERDCVFITGLHRKQSVIEVNLQLENLGLELL